MIRWCGPLRVFPAEWRPIPTSTSCNATRGQAPKETRRLPGASRPRTSDMWYFVPFLWAALAQAPTPPAEPLTPPKVRHALILCGHPGDAEHLKSFTETVHKLGDGLARTVGIPPERQYVLFGADRPKDLPGATG